MYPSNQDIHGTNFSKQAPATGYPVSPPSQYAPDQVPQPHPLHVHETAWSSGLCDCTSDVQNCCITCWCPCITFGQIAEILNKGTTSCAVHGAIYGILAFFTGCGCCYSCLYRTKLRQQYLLEERPCNDCLVHCCCDACALCQEYRELKTRGFDMSIGWQGNVDKQNRGVAMNPTAPVFEGGMTR